MGRYCPSNQTRNSASSTNAGYAHQHSECGSRARKTLFHVRWKALEARKSDEKAHSVVATHVGGGVIRDMRFAARENWLSGPDSGASTGGSVRRRGHGGG